MKVHGQSSEGDGCGGNMVDVGAGAEGSWRVRAIGMIGVAIFRRLSFGVFLVEFCAF